MWPRRSKGRLGAAFRNDPKRHSQGIQGPEGVHLEFGTETPVLLGPIALVPYATPGTQELADNLSRFLPTHDAFLLENHGALTVGAAVAQAANRMDLVEQNARVTMVVRQLGQAYQLSSDELERLMGIRRKMGLGPRSDSWGDERVRPGPSGSHRI